MAFQTVINQQNRTAGIHRSATRTLNNPAARVSLRLVSSWVEADDMAVLGVEQFDGTRWRHRVSATIMGGARDKDGNLPSITFGPAPAGDYRAVLLLARGTSAGLEIEIA